MRFLFDCEDEIALPAAYRLVGDLKPYIEKIKEVDVPDNVEKTRKVVFGYIVENMMVNYPKETGEIFAKLWILDDGEKAPNAFKTAAVLLKNEVAVDFFTSVVPSMLQLSNVISLK